MKSFVLCCATAFTLAFARADSLSRQTNYVDPNQGAPKTAVLLIPTEVRLGITFGSPFGLESSMALPDYAVRAFMQWRYKPSTISFGIKFTIPIAYELKPELERELPPNCCIVDSDTASEIGSGHEMDAEKARKIAAKLGAKTNAGDAARLLVYYAVHISESQEARGARAGLIAWFIDHAPEAKILRTPFAVPDPESSPRLNRLWNAAVNQTPENEAIRANALNAFEVTSPADAIRLLDAHKDWPDFPRWAGSAYALAAVGVNAIDPATGTPASVELPGNRSNIAETARARLLNSTSAPMVLTGLVALTRAGRALAPKHLLPDGFNEFCLSLLSHARQFYPATGQSCDSERFVPEEEVQRLISLNADPAYRPKPLNRIEPEYPNEAKSARLQGETKFLVTISKSGSVKEALFISGLLPFYDSSIKAIKRWRFESPKIRGEAQEVAVVVTTNYEMR